MTIKEKQELFEWLVERCRPIMTDKVICYAASDIRDQLGLFESKTCDCSPSYEDINSKLQKELDYWKCEHASLREENIRLMAILRTVEQFTGKDLLG